MPGTGPAAPASSRSTVIDPPDTEAVSVQDPPPATEAVPAGGAGAAAFAQAAADDASPGAPAGRGPWWWVPGAITIITIASVIVVTLSQLHPSMLLTNTTTTGGDTGAHIAMPKYLESLISHGHLTGWDPGWYDGFPLYTFYFTLPDFFIAVGAKVISYDVAFKLGTILGSVILPVCAWACGRFFRLRPPIPTLLAAATLPFLFDYTFTIYGGNLFSTLAGEYSYSFSLSLAILFLGLFACAVREGRYRGWAAVVLALCVLSHIIPGFYALGGALILTLIELLPARWGIADGGELFWRNNEPRVHVPWTRTLWWAGSTVGIGLLLSGFWLVPFGLEHAYTTSMGYTNVEGWAQYFREADAWALVIAGIGVLLAFWLRSRFGIALTILGIASALATAVDPQGSLYNVRLLPLWFISVYLMAAWTFGTICIAVAETWRRSRATRLEEQEATPPLWVAVAPGGGSGPGGADPGGVGSGTSAWSGPDAGGFGTASAAAMDDLDGDGSEAPDAEPIDTWAGVDGADQPGPPPQPRAARRRPRAVPTGRWAPAAVSGAVLGLLAVMAIVVPPFILPASSLPVTVGPNEVTNWSNYNYEGYEGQASWPEYHSIMQTMDSVSARYGCGREMWEYSPSENRFGTPEALMLLPYWTNGCIDSMEGLLFESSTTTPYHFIDQAELSETPSDPEVGLPYGPVDVTLGVQHLQLLGVKYFMAETPEVEAQANADPALKLVAKTGPWTYDYDGATSHTTWDIYVVKDSPLVSPLANDPVVLSGVKPASSSWLQPSLNWYGDPSRWNVELAQDGPSSWPRTPVSDMHPAVKHVGTTRVTDISQTDTTVSFHVSRVGTPVLVKVSYFPNWHASGADGPWRVTPNLMVVVPTSHDVTLSYGGSSADTLGLLATLAGVILLVALFVVPTLRRWWSRRPAGAHAGAGDGPDRGLATPSV